MPRKKKYTPKELMQMAIVEGRRSIPEHTDKTDPLVGAIITTANGELLAQAHRGELRVGEHCEYTLIERKLVNKNLGGCVLYVTLEPCTDQSRNTKKGKKGCSSHILKARLGKVYVGIEDPNPKIATEGIKLLEKAELEVHMFHEDLQETIRQDNAQFIEEKEEEAKQVKKKEVEEPKSILEAPATGTSVNSFSESVVQNFIKLASMPFAYPSEDFISWGLQFGILEKVGDDVQPNGLGLMLFGSQPEVAFPQTVFKVEINYGNSGTEIKDFNGALVNQLPEVLEYVRDKALKLTIDTSKGIRTVQTDFPFEPLREAIANAIIHRDYTIEGATNYLYIDTDKIVIKSPGNPVAPLTLDDLQHLDASSISRNPKLMYIFNQMDLAEQRGIGLETMKHLPEMGFPLPNIEMRHGSLEITFGRTKDYIAEQVDGNLTDEDKEAFLYVQQEGEVSKNQFAKHFKLNSRTAQRRLARLVDLGLVETKGQAKATVYVVK